MQEKKKNYAEASNFPQNEVSLINARYSEKMHGVEENDLKSRDTGSQKKGLDSPITSNLHESPAKLKSIGKALFGLVVSLSTF